MNDERAQTVFSCETFERFSRCPANCKQEKQWGVDCYDCYGKNPFCKTCNGSGRIAGQVCPRLLSRDTFGLLPFFFQWYVSKCTDWPDGNGMYYQPLKLRDTFNFLAAWKIHLDNKKTVTNGCEIRMCIRCKRQRLCAHG